MGPESRGQSIDGVRLSLNFFDAAIDFFRSLLAGSSPRRRIGAPLMAHMPHDVSPDGFACAHLSFVVVVKGCQRARRPLAIECLKGRRTYPIPLFLSTSLSYAHVITRNTSSPGGISYNSTCPPSTLAAARLSPAPVPTMTSRYPQTKNYTVWHTSTSTGAAMERHGRLLAPHKTGTRAVSR